MRGELDRSGDLKSGNGSWAGLALSAAGVTVGLTTLLTLVRVPRALGQITFAGLGTIVGDTDKVWVMLVWLCAAASLVVCLLLDRRMRSGRLARSTQVVVSVVTIVAFALTIVLSVWTNPKQKVWAGFGVFPAVIGVVIACGLLLLLTRYPIRSKVLTAVSGVVVSLASIAPVIHTPNSFFFNAGYDNQFTVNEVLAPATGRMPGFDFVSQYETLLGYPLALLRLISPRAFDSTPETFGVGWLSLLQIVTLLLAVLAVMRVAPQRLRWLVPVMILPVAYLVGASGLEYFADLPIRFVLPTVLLIVLAFLGMRAIGRQNRWWFVFVPGIVGGAAALNNVDYGVPALLAGLVAVTMASRSLRSLAKTATLYVAGMLVVPIAYVLVGTLLGKTFHPSYLLFFVQSFGVDDYLNVDMPVFGLHSAFVLVGVIGVVIGAIGMRRLTLRNAALHRALLFTSAWLLLSLVYFSGRSLTSTLITGSCFQLAVVLALLFVAGFPVLRTASRRRVRHWIPSDWLVGALVILSLGLPFAAIGSFPSSLDAMHRVRVGAATTSLAPFLLPDPTVAVDAVPRGTSLMGIIAISGSSWSLRLGVRDANVFLHPDYLAFPGGADIECAYLATLPGDSLLATHEVIATLRESSRCTALLDLTAASPVESSRAVPTDATQWMLVPRRS